MVQNISSILRLADVATGLLDIETDPVKSIKVEPADETASLSYPTDLSMSPTVSVQNSPSAQGRNEAVPSTESENASCDEPGGAASSLSQSSSDQSKTGTTSPTPASEKAEILLLQSKVREAIAEVQKLQGRAGKIKSKIESYEKEAAQFGEDKDTVDANMTRLKMQTKDVDAKKRDLEARKKVLHADKNALITKIHEEKKHLTEIHNGRNRVWKKAEETFVEHKSAIRDVDEAVGRQRRLEKQLKDAEYEAGFLKSCPDAAFRQFVRDATKDEGSRRLIDKALTGEVMIVYLNKIEIMLEKAIDGSKDDVKSSQGWVKSEGTISDQRVQLMKTEGVKVKLEHTGTPAPSSNEYEDPVPSARSLLDDYRQMRALRHKIDAKLQKVNLLKRKHEDDEEANKASPGTRRVRRSVFIPKSYKVPDLEGGVDDSSEEDDIEDEDEEENEEDDIDVE